MKPTASIAVETSCRAGGVALGTDDRLVRVVPFDASFRHATQLVQRLKDLLHPDGLRAADLDEVYVSIGPGSFTGLRVGVTAARTLAQAVPHLRCVGVPTSWAVADNARELPGRNLAVVLDAGEGLAYATLFELRDGLAVPAGEPAVGPAREFLARAPRPLWVTGEGLDYHDCTGPDIRPADPALRLPTAEGVWRVGRRLARAGQFTESLRLLPIYARPPKVIRKPGL